MHFSKHTLKQAAWTVGIVAASAYVLSRFLPGLAVRVGLQPRPAFVMQIGWAEPFGLIPVVGPGFSNVLAYGFPPIYSATPAGAAPTAQPAAGQPIPVAGPSATNQTIIATT